MALMLDQARWSQWPKAIIFGLDGTLVDSADDIHASINAVLREEELTPLTRPQIMSFIDDAPDSLVMKAFSMRGRALAEPNLSAICARYVATYGRMRTDQTKLFPGVVEALRFFSGSVRLAVCTNSPHETAWRVLDKLGIAGHFAALVGGDSGFGRKPDPGPILACLAWLQASKNEAVFVGHSDRDVLAARRAGIMSVFVLDSGYASSPASSLGGDTVIRSIGELNGALQAVAASG